MLLFTRPPPSFPPPPPPRPPVLYCLDQREAQINHEVLLHHAQAHSNFFAFLTGSKRVSIGILME